MGFEWPWEWVPDSGWKGVGEFLTGGPWQLNQKARDAVRDLFTDHDKEQKKAPEDTPHRPDSGGPKAGPGTAGKAAAPAGDNKKPASKGGIMDWAKNNLPIVLGVGVGGLVLIAVVLMAMKKPAVAAPTAGPGGVFVPQL
jgi:hypothetical protein